MKDIFQKLMKNPTKLMGLVKTVGDKLDGKMKSGELKESELIAEATEIMNKMKNMPGMDNIQSMLSKMGMGGMAGMAGMGGKVNMGAMESQLNSRMKMAKTKERIRAKAQANAKTKMEQQSQQAEQEQQTPKYSEEELLKLFGSAEKIERTPRGSKPSNDTKKKKKVKK
jgi:spore coat protein CotH